MLKKIMKKTVALALCVVMMVACAANANATTLIPTPELLPTPFTQPTYTPTPMPTPTPPPPTPLDYGTEEEPLIKIDPADKERPFGSTAVFVDGKECKIGDDKTLAIYPDIEYEFRTYFYNESETEALTNVRYTSYSPKKFDGATIYRDEFVTTDGTLRTSELSLRPLDDRDMIRLAATSFKTYCSNSSDGIAECQKTMGNFSNSEEYFTGFVMGYSYTDESVDSYHNSVVIPPQTYGYISHKVFFYDRGARVPYSSSTLINKTTTTAPSTGCELAYKLLLTT